MDITKPMTNITRIMEISGEAKKLAQEYYALTGETSRDHG
jgi:hypothetical protein